MLTASEARDTILYLRAHGYTISGIHAVTGQTITTICEVSYEHRFPEENESNQKDIANDGADTNLYNGVF